MIIKGCSDKKIPISAYHILTTKLKPLAKSIMFGEACSAVPVFKKTSEFLDKESYYKGIWLHEFLLL